MASRAPRYPKRSRIHDAATSQAASPVGKRTKRSSSARASERGKRLLPHLVEQLADEDPNGTWISIPEDNDPSKGFQDVTYKQLALAVDRAAWWISEHIDGGGAQTLAYIGPSDARYLILILAAVKAGHRLLMLSPRNTDSAQRHLLKSTGCRSFLCAKQDEGMVNLKLLHQVIELPSRFSSFR